MPDVDAINESIADAVSEPSSVTVGNQTVSQPSIPDKIAAANHLAGQAVASNPLRAIHRGRFTPVYD